MKYLAIMDSLGAGGAERSNTDLWFYLREKGEEVKIVVFNRRPHGTQKEVLEGGFDVTFLHGSGVFGHARQIKDIIQIYQPDLVHSTLFKSNLRSRVAKLLGARFLHVESLVNTTYDHARLHDPNVKRYKMEGYRLMDGVTVNLFTDHFHAITQEVSKHFQRKLGIRAGKIRVITRGRDCNPISSATSRAKLLEEFDLPPDEIFFITVGRQEYQKGHVYMIEALRKLRDELHFANFRWLLLGREGHASAEIDAKIRAAGLGRRVIKLGHRYDVEELLPGTDLYVFPSLYEGLGVALLEAQAAGLPILCSDIPVLHETTSTRNAVYIDQLNTNEFARQLYRLANDAALRKKMGAESRKNFLEHFLLDKIHEEMHGYFKQLVAQHTSR